MRINKFAAPVLLILAIISAYFLFGKKTSEVKSTGEAQFQTHCASCHLAPDPQNIPKAIWRDGVLPEMAARMGYRYNRHLQSRGSQEERYYVKISNAYPEVPILDTTEWRQIHDYILEQAPDTVHNHPTRRNSDLKQFTTFSDSLRENMLEGNLVNINFEPSTNHLVVADDKGNIYDWKDAARIKNRFDSPVISSILDSNELLITEIGILSPSEIPRGAIHLIRPESNDTLFENLHRPVYTDIFDFNNDGKKEILICEFGHHTGELAMLLEKESVYEKRTLLPFPGSVKVEIEDMNDDGKMDIVVLFAQGKEGIYILYQKSGLRFEAEQVIEMGPEYGSSWFELTDFDKDGHLDIVLVNGDNADYSIFLKPYHGIRIFLNNGANQFAEKWFYPINGATRVLAEDYDMDGDVDFAVSSLFPDSENCPEEGFVYLENKVPEEYLFESFVTEGAKGGNWLMEKGDFDEDGDVDILLGNFSVLSPDMFQSNQGQRFLYLQNNAIE